MSLDALLHPAAIAVVGASTRRQSNGFIVTNNLINHRFPGRVVPINPRLDQLLGLPAARSLTQAPDIDLAILMLRPDRLAEAYLEAAESGVGAVTIAGDLPSGEEGARMLSVAAAGGPRILGGGSMGVMDPGQALMASMSSALLGGTLQSGGLAVLSHSGGLLGSLLNRASDRRIGISKAVSLGQEVDIDLGELITYLADDDATTTIGCVIEGLRDVEGFIDGVQKAHAAGKQVSVYRIGRSAAGQQSALAHSGVLAAPNRAYRGLFDQLGVLEVEAPDDLLDVVYASPELVVRYGSAVGVASLSGGCCGAFADACEAADIGLASLAPATVASAGLNDQAPRNPIDLVTNSVGPEVTEQVLPAGLTALDDDPAVSVVVYADSMLLPIDEVADMLISHQRGAQKPLVVAWNLGSQGAAAFARLQRAGVPTFGSFSVAARWLNLLVKRRGTVDVDPTATELCMDAAAAGVGQEHVLATEAEMTPVLVKAGIPMADGVVVRTPEDVADAVATLGGPVAVKLVSPLIPHRNAADALVLGLEDQTSAVQAAKRLCNRHPLSDPRDGLLVQSMVSIDREYFLGLHRDPQFGLLLLFGRGGVEVEADGNILLRRLPVGPAEIATMVRQVDELAPVHAVVDAAVRLCQLGEALGERLVSIEINPLVTPVGEPDKVVGVDALATFADSAGGG